MRSTSSSTNLQSTIRIQKTILKYQYDFCLQTAKLLLYNIPIIEIYIPGLKLTQYQYLYLRNANTFEHLIFQLQEWHLIRTFQYIIQYATLWRIGYKVQRYSSTALIPLEEFSEDLMFPGEVWLNNRVDLSTIWDRFLFVALEIGQDVGY